MRNKILGLRTVIYRVNDLDAAKKWYAEAFRTEPYFDEPFYVGFSIGGYELGLQPEETSSIVKTENVFAYWGVEEVEAEFTRFIALGATELEKPRDVGDGILVATVKDPWSNVLGLIYNPHFTLTS